MLVDPALMAAVLGRVDRREVRAAQPRRRARPPRRRRASRGRGRGRSAAACRAGGPAACMCEFIPSTQATNASRSRGIGSSGTRWTTTPATVSDATRASRPPRVSTWTSTPARTSASDSLLTCRASPPATIGGYSHDRIRTRVARAARSYRAGYRRATSRRRVRCAICAGCGSRDLHVTTAHDPPRLHRPGRPSPSGSSSSSAATTTTAAAARGARRALLELGGGPDGSRAVALTRWRYRADPSDRGLRRRLGRRRLARPRRDASRTRRTPNAHSGRGGAARVRRQRRLVRHARSTRPSAGATRCASSPRTTARGSTSTASRCAATPAPTSRSPRARCCAPAATRSPCASTGATPSARPTRTGSARGSTTAACTGR